MPKSPQRNIPDTLPRQQISIAIQGYQFALVMPYTEGHVLSDIEAGVLNREWTNGVRANFAEKVREAIAKANADGTPINLSTLQAELLHYADEYAFKALIQRHNSDPIVQEAHKIAKRLLDTKLNSMGITRETYGEALYEQNLSKIMNTPAIVREATDRVESARRAANELIGLED